MRKDFCQFLLSVFPLLQEYANIAYNNETNQNSNNGVQGSAESQQNVNAPDQYRTNRHSRVKEKHSKKSMKNQKKNELLKPVVPIISIDIPD